jgi:hypothetical protein
VLKGDEQVALVNVNCILLQERRKFLFEPRPGDSLGLLQERGNVKEQAEFLFEPDRLVNQFHDGKFGVVCRDALFATQIQRRVTVNGNATHWSAYYFANVNNHSLRRK